MGAPREIRAREIINDIVSGLEDTQLMNKYRLTFRGLQSVYRKLRDSNIVNEKLLAGRILPQLNAESTIVTRMPRKDIFLPLPVEDAACPGMPGVVTNITDRGLGIKGLKANVDEIKKLVIKPDKYFQLMQFSLKAKCRWVKPSDDGDSILSGFETIPISHRDQQKLRNLIETLEYMYR
jgi:hypothetical protein